MNSNIRELSPFVWAVNFQHIKMGWIKDLVPGEDFDPTTSVIIDNTGRYLVNTEDDHARCLIPFLVMMPRLKKTQLHKRTGLLRTLRSLDHRTMGMSDPVLERKFKNAGVDLGEIERVFDEVCNWEVERRKKMKIIKKRR